MHGFLEYNRYIALFANPSFPINFFCAPCEASLTVQLVFRPLALLSLCCGLAWSVGACAQEDQDPEEANSVVAQATASAEEPAVKKQNQPDLLAPREVSATDNSVLSGPDVFLLPDKEGKLRKVLGFRYDDFRRAWLQAQQPAEHLPPKFVLQSVKILGTATENSAQLRLEFQILTNTSGWLSIPLQLPKLVVHKATIDPPQQGECFVFDPASQGYALWLKGQPGKVRTVVLEGSVRLQKNNDESLLALRLPRGVQSELTLKIPHPNVQIKASEAAQFLETSVEEQSTQLRLKGLTTSLRISWRQLQKKAAQGEPVLEAIERTIVRINRRRLRYESTLQINHFGSPVDSLRIQLPPGSTLSQLHMPNQEKIRFTEKPLGETSSRVVEIELGHLFSSQKAGRRPWSLQLTAEQQIQDTSQKAPIALTGFRVLDADRQSGTVALDLEDQLQAYYDLQENVEQIRLSELPEALSEELPTIRLGNNYHAGFSYSRFPWKLNVHATAQQRRVRVRPQFDLQLGEKQTRLKMVLGYQFAGARNFSLKIKTHGWKLSEDPIESGGAIDSSRPIVTSEGDLILRLVNPDTQRAKLSFTLLRDTKLGEMAFQMPEPVGTFVLPGSLTVSPASSLQVVPNASAMEGMVALVEQVKPETPPSKTARNGQDDVFHYRTYLPRAVFGAQVTQRERRVVAHLQTRVEVQPAAVRVVQQFRYQVDYRPVEQLLLRLPWELWHNESLTARIEGREVPLNLGGFDESELADALRDSSDCQVVITLSRPVQDSLVLEILYEVPSEKITLDRATPLALPLAIPEDPVATSEASVLVHETVRATLQATSGLATWTPRGADDPSSESNAGLQLTSVGIPSFLPLELQLVSPEERVQSILERVWLQTWLVGSVQQDRAVFRFRPQRPTIVVRLPPEIAEQPIEVLLNHQVVSYESLDENRIVVALPEAQREESHTLELRYQQSVALAGWKTLRTTAPQLECRSTGAQVIWQLILPPEWCATSVPESLIAEYWVGWKNLRWGRQPTCSQTDLRLWAGAAPSLPPPPSSVQYVFRASEDLSSVQIAVVPRLWLCLAGGLVAFGIGLLGMYTTLARQRVFWLAIAILLLLLVASYPEGVVLAIQILLLGGAMTLAAGLLRRALQGRAKGTSIRLMGSAASMTSPTESWSKAQASDVSLRQPTTSLPAESPPP